MNLINTGKIIIWGREFSLPIVYDTLKDGKILEEQLEAINTFLENSEWIENAKSVVVDYCREDFMDDDNNDKKDNIFSYIKPERIYVKHERDCPRVAIMCKYRYDPEHGLAVVFSSTGEVTVGIQDIII